MKSLVRRAWTAPALSGGVGPGPVFTTILFLRDRKVCFLPMSAIESRCVRLVASPLHAVASVADQFVHSHTQIVVSGVDRFN